MQFASSRKETLFWGSGVMNSIVCVKVYLIFIPYLFLNQKLLLPKCKSRCEMKDASQNAACHENRKQSVSCCAEKFVSRLVF